MIKKSNCGKIGAIVAVIAVVAMLGLAVYDSNSLYQEVRVDSPPPIVEPEPLTIENCVVGVSTLHNGQRRFGNGVIVEENGETFILTSNMIFVDDYESITITIDEWTASGELITTSDECGLAAVRSDPEFNEGYPISVASNIPAQTKSVAISEIGSAHVMVLNYISDDWFLITGVDENFVGAPLVNGGEITGIVIGQNRVSLTQSIVVANEAIKAFVEQVMLLGKTGPPVLYEPPLPLQPPANPNLLFGGK